MNIRALDYEKDLDEVIELIKRNLNPHFSKETIIWKHQQNPLGKSMAIVATDHDKIIGVVFAMRYNFKNGKGEVIRGIKPLDACTDKEYRGKGIYKKIMQLCVRNYRGEFDFLIANPNIAAFPETLKIGYAESKKKYYYKMSLINPLVLSKKEDLIDVKKMYASKSNSREWTDPISFGNYYVSGNSLEYILWRYRDESYIIKQFEGKRCNNYIIYRVETKKYLKFLIICDFYGNIGDINKVIGKICREEKILFIYYLHNEITKKINFLFTKYIKKAIVVFKEEDFLIPDELVISLGDLEGRL